MTLRGISGDHPWQFSPGISFVSKVVVHRKMFSINDHLKPKDVFQQRKSSIKICLQLKVVFHQKLSSIGGHLLSDDPLAPCNCQRTIIPSVVTRGLYGKGDTWQVWAELCGVKVYTASTAFNYTFRCIRGISATTIPVWMII